MSELGKGWQGRLALGQLCCYNMARYYKRKRPFSPPLPFLEHA